ncbi:hypothetical protein C8C83_4505 [Flavobacterium sp. 90]|uniref:hypothetical protein n=1 Tax=unclassified Flavobacterium TaxID=196869 RepID=UPI000EB54746|nr:MULTISPECIES: hypothetical protein [unclassified Flavobacterium]RKR05172.1 hypothetical protein C8C82_4846 [Flavobacterium sp. 81]TCK56488.1 hypothetical protein C8C83_4505 [Flavobacterium sp. 90]
MKKAVKILLALTFILTGCNSKGLDNKTAEDLIIQKYKYPKIVYYDVFCGDPVHARRAIDEGLEEKGLVTVDRTQKFKDIGNPLIHFTDSAKPYLLETPEEDKKYNIQRVKIADERFGEITRILSNTSNKEITIVEYTIVRDKNDFGPLWKNLDNKSKRKEYFYFTDEGWQIIDKSDVELMNLKIY